MNEPTSLGRENGHRGSTSSESEVRVPEDTVQIHLTNGEVQQLQLSTGEVEEVERKQEEVQELHLTDDLADSLMNPPTEPEQSDEEPNHCTHGAMKVETEEVLLEDQEVQGITEAVEELAAKNKVSQESSGSSLSEEVTRESLPQLAAEDKVSSMKVSPMPETLVMEEEQCEKTENSTSTAADPVEKEVPIQEMEVDTVKEEVVTEVNVTEKEETVAQTTVGDNETGGEAPKANKQQSRGPRNNRQGGKRTWEKERKKEKKVEMEKKVAAAEKSEETAKTTTSLTELPKKSYSSAMKSNLVEKAGNNSSAAAVPKPNSSSSQKEERPVQRVPAVKETPAVRESEEVWETVPPSVASGEPESWERTPQSKKRKHKKSAREAVVRFETKEEEIHSSAAPALVKEDEVPKNEVKEAKEAVAEVKEEVEEAE